MLTRRRLWPVVLGAAAASELVLDLTHGTGLLASVGFVLANTAEPLTGAFLLTSLIAVVDLRRTRDLGAFIGFAVVVGPVVGAMIAAVTWSTVVGGHGAVRFAFEWWCGDGLGVLVVGGALVALRFPPRLPLWRLLEAVAVAAVAVTATVTVFEVGRFEFVYVPVALLVVLAFRVGTAGVAVTSAVVAFVAAGLTAESQDFWASVDIAAVDRVLYMQLALGVLVSAVLALAAEISERERIAVELARTESERKAAVERAKLFDAEQAARRRAEVLERHVARLVTAERSDEVADATLAALDDIGVDAAWVQLVGKRELQLVAHRGVPRENQERYAAYPLDARTPAAEAIRTHEVVEAGTRDDLDERFPDASPGAHRLGVESMVAVPLQATHGGVIGALSVSSRERHWLDDGRRTLLVALAEQCGLALERAALRVEADGAVADTTLLAQLGEVVVRPTQSHARARGLVEVLTAERTVLAVVHLLDEAGRPKVLEQASTARAAGIDEKTLTGLAARAASSVDGASASVGELELLAYPLRARDETLGVLTIAFGGEERGVSLGLFRRIAIRAALAIDNAILYERERDVSHSLQLGLLGGELEVPAETAIATAYRPGTAALEVGGDWYDAFALTDGRLAILVGDVVGHGLEAAVAMGQLRGAVRALAPMGPPNDVLDRLDRLVETLPEAGMATIAYAELDLEDGSFVYACAGHPPPLVVSAAGEPRLLWSGRTAPLGSSFAKGREQASDRLEPGDTLVLYTDGLVERRATGISERLDLLLEVAGREGPGDPEALVDRVLDALLGDEVQEDDVCVLAVRRVTSELRFSHSFPALPSEVAHMRHAFARWLEQVELSAGERRDAVLAVSEAAANAAEHAYAFDATGVVQVEASVAGSDLRVTVTDQGTWREPRADTDRGRGRTMMHALMRDVTIESGSRGTVVQMRLPTKARGGVSV